MKKTILYIMFVCLFAFPTYATHYEITTNIYTPGLTLQTGDSLYMTNGGFDSLILRGNSTATIENTSTLDRFYGGIWLLSMWDNSHFDLWGGEIHQLDLNNYATATLRSGLIESIYSYQIVPEPHIKLYYFGELPYYNEITDILTGLWGNGDPFSIYLHDVTGYAPVIDNIEFILIPEPASLALLALGGLLIRRKR